MYGGDRGYQQRILAKINVRTQGRNELTRDYIVNLQAMILKLTPVSSMVQQLDMLHRNMRPELQKMVMRNQITDYRGLLDLAREAELALLADKVYHSPLPPERTYLPEFAYVPSEPPVAPHGASTVRTSRKPRGHVPSGNGRISVHVDKERDRREQWTEGKPAADQKNQEER